MNWPIRTFLHLWAKSAIAPGYLYQIVDRYGEKFSRKKIWKKTLGSNWFECNLKDHIQKQIYYFGAYEPIESFLLSRIISKEMTIIDAGANIGFYSLTMANKIENGQIYSFEPILSTFEQLNKHIKKSKKEHLIKAINAGLWHKKEQLTFSLSDNQSNNIGAFTAGKSDFNNQTLNCQVTTLDQFVAEENINKVDLIKMDIEGAELYALKGATNTLKKFKPTILLEVCKETCERFDYSPQELWEIFKPHNYLAYEIGSTLETTKKITSFDHINQSNVILTTKNLDTELLSGWNDKKIRKLFAKKTEKSTPRAKDYN